MSLHPPHLLDLVPHDLWLFQKAALSMQGQRSESLQDIKAARWCNERHAQKKAVGAASESSKNEGEVFKVWRQILAMCLSV